MGDENRIGKYSRELDFPGYAQEFLRRNPKYRNQLVQMAASIDEGAPPVLQEVVAREWGLNFPCPPDRPACAAPASWSPVASPFTVILEPAPPGFSHACVLELSNWPIVLADRMLSDGRHIVLGDVDGPHHIWLRSDELQLPLAFAIPSDELADLRQLAATRLHRRLRGAAVARKIRAHRPSRYQRHRLDLLLAILDQIALAGAARATTYQIARTLVYPNIRFRNNAEWKSSSQRRQTQRLVDDAIKLMQDGYRVLLRGKTRCDKNSARK